MWVLSGPVLQGLGAVGRRRGCGCISTTWVGAEPGASAGSAPRLPQSREPLVSARRFSSQTAVVWCWLSGFVSRMLQAAWLCVTCLVSMAK